MTKKQEHNALTGETVVRDMTADELALVEADALEAEAKLAAEAQRATDRAALLTKLGITEAEAKLLLG
jgi:hypothetical protein